MGESRQNALRYTRVAITLHWAMAALILVNIAVGLIMEGLPQPQKGVAVPFHISCGMTVLALALLRVLWRLTHEPPPLAGNVASWERHAAHTAHALLYVLMIAMPFIGWAIISAHPPRPQGAASLWGFIRLPALSPISHLADPEQKAAHATAVSAHSLGGWILMGVLVLHIAGALKHQWIDRHPELARMGIGRRQA